MILCKKKSQNLKRITKKVSKDGGRKQEKQQTNGITETESREYLHCTGGNTRVMRYTHKSRN